MPNINFHQIKSFNGSQRDAFEEMCCQLASFNVPQKNSIFCSKDGSGGDAGVECYWKLPDGSEHAWQAKYFPDTFGINQWKQIDDSIKTAIKKHPNIMKYYICIPKDRTDRRVIKEDGTEENSLKKEWDDHVKKWNTWCDKANIKIDFVYWGKHELTTMLSTNDSKYAGCALYWFDTVVFTQNTFELNFEKAKNSLGDRYMPELNVELKNVEKYFDAIALSKSWVDLLNNKLDQWIKLKKDYHFRLQEANIDNSVLEELSSNLTSLIETFEEFIKDKNFSKHKNIMFSFLEQILSSTMTIMDWSHELEPEKRNTKEGKNLSKISSNIYKYYDASSSLKSFFNSKEFGLSQNKNMLLIGEPGIGKSHLLASIVEERVSKALPTLFFLGQHYNGNNPWNFILDELDYRRYSVKNILGALSSAAKAKKTNALIVIDAINEGPHSDGWQNHLSNFITEINSFDNMKLIISCRTTFVKRLIKIDKEKHSLIDVIHTGFKGFEHLAASIYLDKQGIGRPSAPILAPEFSNPLFLRLACEALKLNSQTSFPRGLRGIRSLFAFYSNAKNSVISASLQLDNSDNILTDIFDVFSLKLFEEELYGLDKKNCIKLIDEIVGLYGKKGYDVLLSLLEEGVLSEDISYSSDQDCNGVKIIKFTYERFSDYKIAELIIDKYFNPNDLITTFSNENLFGKIFKNNYIIYEKAGIVEAISVIIPEKYNLELIDIIPKKLKTNNVILDSFEYSLVWRDSKSFTDKTLYYLNGLRSYSFSHFPHHDILLKLSTEPNHPWNAEMLHRNLIDKSMPERDEFWSIYTALNYFEEDEDQGESIIKTIIDWAWYANIENTENERVRLCSIILVWLFSTPNRKVRDYSSKALVSILSKKSQFMEELLHKFKDINDSYILERLYCAVYGAILIVNDIQVISKISNITYELFFKEKEPYPNMLTRDYARGIVEKANNLGCLEKEIDLSSVRPPYKSKFKLKDIPKGDLYDIIKRYDDQYSSIKSSIMGFPGDFGNYIMDDVHKWTSTLLLEKEPLSQDTLEEEFLTGLTIEQINLYKNYRNYIDISRKLTSKQLEKLIEEGTKYSDLIESEEDDFDIEYFELEDDPYKKEKDLEGKFTSTLTDEQSEYFRWLKGSGRGDKNIACFSRKLAQRWVCNRVYELGWRKEKFKEYDDSYAKNGRYSSRSKENERIGKKYQWIAFFELLAHISDNYHYLGDYIHEDKESYKGPWQLWIRDIDPSILIKESQHTISKQKYDKNEFTWWKNYNVNFVNMDDEEKKEWLKDEGNLPEIESIIRPKNIQDNSFWIIPDNFFTWDDDYDKEILRRSLWIRIDSCVVKNSDVNRIVDKFENRDIRNKAVSASSTNHQIFFKEILWHQSCFDKDVSLGDDWYYINEFIKNAKSLSMTYDWEGSREDNSINELISIPMPSATLINGLCLKPTEDYYNWYDKDNKLVFFDPSNTYKKGSSTPLINENILQGWLKKNDLNVIWNVIIEKSLYYKKDHFFARQISTNICFYNNSDSLETKSWISYEGDIK